MAGAAGDGLPAAANGTGRLTAAQRKKLKKKEREKSKKAQKTQQRTAAPKGDALPSSAASTDSEVVVEYVSAPQEVVLEELLSNLGVSSGAEDAAGPTEGLGGAPSEAAGDQDDARAVEADEREERVTAGNGAEAAQAEGDEGRDDQEEDADDDEDRHLGLGLDAGGGLGLGASETAGLGLGATAGVGAGTGSAPVANGFVAFKKASSEPAESAEDVEAKKAAALEDFKRILGHFASAEEVTSTAEEKAAAANATEGADGQQDDEQQDGGVKELGKKDALDSDSEAEDEETGVSKKKRKQDRRLKIAELKKDAARPDVVEVWDVTAPDPKLLVYLKSYRNTVAVPRHWSQKRRYLQGKRGLEKPLFRLPEFIEATGIGDMRMAYHDKEDSKKLKQKQRERMQPKMGKLDIDYGVLHDAFFKHQKPPPFTKWGELYYEGKEFEAKIGARKPGVLSPALQEALGLTPGAPPPWLVNMQRYGTPPSYPDLKIPGLNAPIPPGASFGYQPGGWGKPPVDEEGVPLYGDVFAAWGDEGDSDVEVDKATRFGELKSDEESEEESEEEESEEEEVEEMADGFASVASAVSSMPSGLETPEVIDLRKKGTETPAALYTVLEQRQANVGAGIMGTDHVYVLPGQEGSRPRTAATNQRRLEALKQAMPTDVEVAIDPEELEGLDDGQLRTLYEARAREARTTQREDFSDLVAQKAAEQKRKAAKQLDGKAKKQKDSFKF